MQLIYIHYSGKKYHIQSHTLADLKIIIKIAALTSRLKPRKSEQNVCNELSRTACCQYTTKKLKIKDPADRTEREYTNKIHDNKNRITKASVRRRLTSLHLTCSV